MADDHDALMHALEAPDPPAQGRPIRDALAPLAFSPRRVIEALHDAAKTRGTLHDARKELRRRLLALLFDGEPLRVRATGADLHWDDEDQSDKVRAAATFDERGDGVSTFQLSVALDGFFRPKELAACLYKASSRQIKKRRSGAPTSRRARRTSSKSTSAFSSSTSASARRSPSKAGRGTNGTGPSTSKKLQSHYPSIGEVLRHVQFLRVRVFRQCRIKFRGAPHRDSTAWWLESCTQVSTGHPIVDARHRLRPLRVRPSRPVMVACALTGFRRATVNRVWRRNKCRHHDPSQAATVARCYNTTRAQITARPSIRW